MEEIRFHKPSTPLEESPRLSRWDKLLPALGPGRKRFTMLPRREYDALDADARREFDRARKRFMAGGMTIHTQAITDLIALFEKADMMNDGALVGRRGVMVSAPPSTGKSTACVSLIEYVLAQYDREHPGALAGGAVPAIYASIPPTRTVKGTLQRIARFLGLPFKPSDTEADLAAMLEAVLPLLGTKLIVLDEVQMLKAEESTSRPAVNNLKDLTNYFQGTIVYSGVSLTDSGFMFGDAGLQLGRRVFPVAVPDFTGSLTASKAAEWKKTVESFARALPLYATDPLSVRAESKWLHSFTGGTIGTLKSVLFDAAATLIQKGDPGHETITREVLATAPRDYKAESGGIGVRPEPLPGATKRRKLANAGR
jgi:hypothetical protein